MGTAVWHPYEYKQARAALLFLKDFLYLTLLLENEKRYLKGA